MDGHEPQDEEKVSHRSTGLAERRCVLHNASVRFLACLFRVLWTDFLQERLSQETSHPEFSQFPFRFTEIAKLLLDV